MKLEKATPYGAAVGQTLDKPQHCIGNTKEKPTVANDAGPIWKDCRGDKTAIELFIAGVRGWEAKVWRQQDDGIHFSD